jgi:hypothetical protein
MSSTDVAVRTSQDLEALNELEALLLSDERPDVVDDPREISREIMRQLLGASSDAELELVGSAIGWRRALHIPFTLHSFRWRPSSFDEGSNVFFVIEATALQGFTAPADGDVPDSVEQNVGQGERVVLTTGAGNILAQLTNMAKRGTLDGAVRAAKRADKPTRQGYYPLWLYTPAEFAPVDGEVIDDAELVEPAPADAPDGDA